MEPTRKDFSGWGNSVVAEIVKKQKMETIVITNQIFSHRDGKKTRLEINRWTILNIEISIR